jgi:hypothetical protein
MNSHIQKKTFFSLFFLGFLLAFFIRCHNEINTSSILEKINLKDTVTPQTIIKKPGSSYSDTLFIDGPSALFFNPDSIQVEKYKTIVSNNMFESMKHDCYFQQRNSKIVLKKYWPKIKIIETAKTRYLVFIKSNKTQSYIDLDGKGDICGIFLFNTIKDPQIIDMMNVETELDYYFNH